jgi:hypothetical protein
MNIMVVVPIVLGVPISLLLVLATLRFVRTPTWSSVFVMIGSASVLVMVLAMLLKGCICFRLPGVNVTLDGRISFW